MGDVVAKATEPVLAAIKLTWWRDRLEELDQGRTPAEPRLQAAATWLLSRGIKGAELAELELPWAQLLAEQPDLEAALQRGVILFDIAARLIGSESDLVPSAGRIFAAGNFHRRSLALPSAFVTFPEARIPRKLRPLTALAALAKRDLFRSEPEATPRRAWTVLRHRLTGRL